MQIVDKNGKIFDAATGLETDKGIASVVFESRGPGRNTEYIPAMDLVFARLATVGATVVDAQVVSSMTVTISEMERRLSIPGRPFPFGIAEGKVAIEIAKSIRKAAAKVGRGANAGGNGNPTRRLQIWFTYADLEHRSEEWLSDQLFNWSSADTTHILDQVVRPGRSSGQGFRHQPEARKAVELRAMDVATLALERSWETVLDVSGQESFDLLCQDRGNELHVEVKGTTGAGNSVVLTRAEVAHARKVYPRVALYVVSEITLKHVDEQPLASDGILTRYEPFNVDSYDLDSLAYSCTLPRKMDRG